ncbi:hypothetical protein [Cohnella thailandensis]|uniref:Uncharacterized protein n=1 Tax=Cohnella thailandensis TaxID=557557 RepID=A0A841SUV4_9BACL|nr:hypothetical protein [Cohnella thailandensis]MBB6635694.1 hypothetical protein [Cohnella thailandensis]MBP1976070.1 hypothetical protein [Cohnella thailandensis]
MKKILLSLLLCFSLVSTTTITDLGQKASADTTQINKYLGSITASKQSDGRFLVTYTIKEDFVNPSYEKMTFGYHWPNKYPVAGSTQELSKKKGTYTYYIPKPASYIGQLTFEINYNLTGSYQEAKKISTIFNFPAGNTVTYHTVTATEAGAAYVLIVGAPALAFEFNPGSKILKWIGRAYLGWSLYDGFSNSTGLANTFPMLKAGQYYKTTSWYTSDGYVHIKYEIWDTKAAFDKGVAASYTGTLSSPQFPYN